MVNIKKNWPNLMKNGNNRHKRHQEENVSCGVKMFIGIYWDLQALFKIRVNNQPNLQLSRIFTISSTNIPN